jgi:hypothetical protein
MSTVKQTVRERCQQNQSKYQNEEEIISACMRTLGVRRKQVQKILKSLGLRKSSGPAAVGISEEELRAKCDILYKIEQAVKNLPENRYIPDAEFREFFCQINANKYRAKADLPTFEKFKGRANGVTYWARPENIKRLKESGVLQ